jgi:hypothetical protein
MNIRGMNSKVALRIIDNPSFKLIITSIKIVSTILISGAIIWELGHIYARVQNWEFGHNLGWIFWLDRIALISHGIEALIAAYYARSYNKNLFKYSVYTFFVGTVGLLELNVEK